MVLPICLFPGVTGRALKLGNGPGGLSLEVAGGWGGEHISSTLSRARRGPGSAAKFLQVFKMCQCAIHTVNLRMAGEYKIPQTGSLETRVLALRWRLTG